MSFTPSWMQEPTLSASEQVSSDQAEARCDALSDAEMFELSRPTVVERAYNGDFEYDDDYDFDATTEEDHRVMQFYFRKCEEENDE